MITNSKPVISGSIRSVITAVIRFLWNDAEYNQSYGRYSPSHRRNTIIEVNKGIG